MKWWYLLASALYITAWAIGVVLIVSGECGPLITLIAGLVDVFFLGIGIMHLKEFWKDE